MKKILLAVAALMATSALYGQIPNVKVENAKGETISTSTLGEHKVPLIVSFWSTTCKPCMLELNAINEIMEEWLEEADFKVVAVSIDDSRSASKAKALVSGNGWDDFIVLYDKNQELKRALNVNMVPHVFIFDKDGNQVYSHVGYTPGTEEEYIKKIKSLK